jgi:hypothetical protein
MMESLLSSVRSEPVRGDPPGAVPEDSWWRSACTSAESPFRRDDRSEDASMAEVMSQLISTYTGLERLMGSAYSMPASFDVAARGLAVVVELLDQCCELVWNS